MGMYKTRTDSYHNRETGHTRRETREVLDFTSLRNELIWLGGLVLFLCWLFS
jgi:hypothetical protein